MNAFDEISQNPDAVLSASKLGMGCMTCTSTTNRQFDTPAEDGKFYRAGTRMTRNCIPNPSNSKCLHCIQASQACARDYSYADVVAFTAFTENTVKVTKSRKFFSFTPSIRFTNNLYRV